MGKTVAVILAGGRARRMGGGDKCLALVGGRTILARTLAVIGPQVAGVVLNANGDAGRFGNAGVEVVADSMADWPGPLAGILAGLDWAAARGATWVVSVPGDCPFLPNDLVARLHAVQVAEGAVFACAESEGRVHPAAGLWPVSGREDLQLALAAGERRVRAYTARQTVAMAVWGTSPVDPFLNINSPEDLVEANRLAEALCAAQSIA